MAVIRGNVYHRQMNDQDSDAQGRRSGARGGQAQNWTGRGKVQALMSGDELNLRVDAVTTQTRRFKSLIGEFFRLEFKRARPKWGPYEVVIEIQRTPDSPTHDVDNVAKAVLDALSQAQREQALMASIASPYVVGVSHSYMQMAADGKL